MVSRLDRGSVANWWWTIDRAILAACFALIGIGIVASFAASPGQTHRINIADSFHFAKLHIRYILPALVLMVTISFFSPRNIRRLCLLSLMATLVLLVLVLRVGVEIKGSVRWIDLGFATIQPSEFMKPAFVVIAGWLFAQQNKSGKISGYIAPFLLYCLCAMLLVKEPDVGQTLLISAAWGALFFLAGVPWAVVFVLLGFAFAGVFGAYTMLPHVHERIDSFLTGEDGFQIRMAYDAIVRGGWFGQGPGEGTIKGGIPDGHTDFVFSVVAEEYGIILCMIIVALFAFIVIRSLYIAMKEPDAFTRFSTAGIAILFGMQSVINIAVNLGLMPPKGMTLPFISYGGSSLVAIGLTMGCLLALTRRRPETRKSALLQT